jgi:hypothetical protein
MTTEQHKWIVVRDEGDGQPIALYLCRYDVKNGVWYNVQSGGSYSADDFADLEVWTGPTPTSKG